MAFRNSTYLFSLVFMMNMLFTVETKAQFDPLILNVSSAMGLTGTQVCLDVTAENFNVVESIQFILSYNALLVVPECPATYVHPLLANNIFGDIFNCNNKKNGYLNFIWASDATTIPDGEIIFTLCFNIIGNPGNISPVYFNGLILDIEVCRLGQDGFSVCTEELTSNVGTIKIISNTLLAFYNKCDADSDNSSNGGSLTFYGTGGTPPYTYTVMPGAYSGTLTADGERFTINNIPVGVYTLMITDANLLTASINPISVSDNIPLTLDSIATRNPTCADRKNGYINIEKVNGGITPYTFQWSTLLSGIQLDSIGALSADTYTVTITDFNGCEKTQMFTLSLDTMKMNLTITKDASCIEVKDGSVSITASGGTAWVTGQPYEFSLNGNNWIRFTPPHTISNLGTGTFTLNVRDSLFCDTDAMAFNIPFNRMVNMTINKTDALCKGSADAELKITASPYSIDYTFLPLINFPNLGIIKTDTFSVNNIGAGNYAYRVLDADGCRDTLFFSINEPDSLKINPVVVQPNCTTSGSITVAPNGGTGSYNYTWDPVQAGNPNVLTGLNGGTYSVTVTDANDCTSAINIILAVNANLTAVIAGANSTCVGSTTTLTASGGTDYEWSTGDNTNSIDVGPGTYTVTVSNASGCTGTTQKVITTSPSLTAVIEGANSICTGSTTTLTASGGADYEWSTGENSSSIDVGPGTYTVTVSNTFGCTSTTTKTLAVNNAPIATIIGESYVCPGQSATFTAFGGINYFWSNGETTADITVNTAGTYSVSVTDANGCTSAINKTLVVNNALLATIIGSNEICQGSSTEFTATGGISYIWNTTANTDKITVNTAGSYSVTVTDANGCTTEIYTTQLDQYDSCNQV